MRTANNPTRLAVNPSETRNKGLRGNAVALKGIIRHSGRPLDRLQTHGTLSDGRDRHGLGRNDFGRHRQNPATRRNDGCQ